jgi:LacI family transcriptional regulator
MEFNPSLVVENCIIQEAGAEAVMKLISEAGIDAIFAASDFSALGAIRRLKDMQVEIPGKIKITGFANEPFAELIDPALSSVEQNAFEMGNQIARAIIDNIGKGEIPDEEIHVPVRLIPRQSSIMREESSLMDSQL